MCMFPPPWPERCIEFLHFVSSAVEFSWRVYVLTLMPLDLLVPFNSFD
jgi:hypothetical protein